MADNCSCIICTSAVHGGCMLRAHECAGTAIYDPQECGHCQKKLSGTAEAMGVMADA